MSNVPQAYNIGDFLNWDRHNQLLLQPKFQRGSVWTPQAQSFLIDTILNEFPIPSVYIRTIVDPNRKTTIREVVDGQQRLRTIISFADGEIKVGYKSSKFYNKSFHDLDDETKSRFLSFPISTVQLINVSDSDILEIFARLNSYSVKVTAAELRHSKYDNPLKWAIWDTTRDWAPLWNDFHVVSVRDSIRLKNTTLIADAFMTIRNGLSDGGEEKVDAFYKAGQTWNADEVYELSHHVNSVIAEIVHHYSPHLAPTTFFKAPNFLILFSAIAFVEGRSKINRYTEHLSHYIGQPIDKVKATEILVRIGDAVYYDDEDAPYASFVAATKSTTQRISSRRIRFQTVVEALCT